jgi:hypothetical protein
MRMIGNEVGMRWVRMQNVIEIENAIGHEEKVWNRS